MNSQNNQLRSGSQAANEKNLEVILKRVMINEEDTTTNAKSIAQRFGQDIGDYMMQKIQEEIHNPTDMA